MNCYGKLLISESWRIIDFFLMPGGVHICEVTYQYLPEFVQLMIIAHCGAQAIPRNLPIQLCLYCGNAAEWTIDRLRFRRIRPSNFERNLCGRFTGRSRRHLNRQYDITIIISILRQFFCRCGRNKTRCFI